MYLNCYTAEETAKLVGLEAEAVKKEIQALWGKNENDTQFPQSANFQNDFKPPIYQKKPPKQPQSLPAKTPLKL